METKVKITYEFQTIYGRETNETSCFRCQFLESRKETNARNHRFAAFLNDIGIVDGVYKNFVLNEGQIWTTKTRCSAKPDPDWQELMDEIVDLSN